MLGIYSLIWTICHKLRWFHQNAVLFHIIFVMTHGEIFGHLGHTGPLTVKTKWCCRRCIGGDGITFMLLLEKNTIALRVQRFAAGANIICLTYATDWWAAVDPVIQGESKSQATRSSIGPCGSTSHFVNNRHSKVKTQGASCIGGFGQTDGRRKFELGIPQSQGASYIGGAFYIRDKTEIWTFIAISQWPMS